MMRSQSSIMKDGGLAYKIVPKTIDSRHRPALVVLDRIEQHVSKQN